MVDQTKIADNIENLRLGPFSSTTMREFPLKIPTLHFGQPRHSNWRRAERFDFKPPSAVLPIGRRSTLSRLLLAAIIDDLGSTLLAFAGILSVDPFVRPRLS
ncbi:hypothetical protein A6U98_11540 [Rhizobium sp. WYCCWR10014]|uniref:hypothetical protein n=1 Tax=Rhizobium sp. WYCCWR10014 TaxID=1825933 RepID=UPI0007E4AB81|nr:hypothetical protein [Rhizobium sp. WYCCWR10014]OAV57463.1 hypothetical protein A6U98_11540 [Rhizobium sp. WYCCWR10014]